MISINDKLSTAFWRLMAAFGLSDCRTVVASVCRDLLGFGPFVRLACTFSSVQLACQHGTDGTGRSWLPWLDGLVALGCPMPCGHLVVKVA